MSQLATISVCFPLEDGRATERHEFTPGTSLAEALLAISPDRWGGGTCDVYFGAMVEGTEIDLETAPDVTLHAGELWHVMVLPGEIFSAAALAATIASAGVGTATAAVLGAIASFAIMSAISMAISFAVSMLLRPGRQGDRAAAAADQPSALNSLAPPRNMMRPASRIPEIYGRVRTWPDLLFPAWATWSLFEPHDMPNNAQNTRTSSVQDVTAVYCVGRGNYETGTYRFGEADLSAVNGSVAVYPPGSTLPDSVRMARAVGNLSRLDLPGAGPDQLSPWYAIPGDAVSEFQIQVSFPGGLYGTVSGAGVTPGRNFVWMHAEFFVQAYRFDANDSLVEVREWRPTFGAQTTNELRNTMAFAVTPGRWQVRVGEVASGSGGFFNAVPQRKCMLEGVTGFEQISAAHRTFEDETVLIVKANNRGGSALQNLEEFSAIVARILPGQASGAPPGTPGTPFPNESWMAAAMHTLTDPQTCAYSHNQVDWNSVQDVWLALGQANEDNFNALLDRVMSADEQIQMIARKARAQVFISNGRVTFARDERRPGVSALFNRRNRMADRASVGLGLRFPGPDEHDAIEIQWIDSDNDWRLRTYTYPEGVEPLNPLSIDLVGATHWHEIYRRARYEFALIRYRRRSMPLRVTEEGQLLMPYDRVSIVQPWDEGVIDGEVLQVLGTDFRLSREVPLYGPSAGLRLRAPDGRETSLHRFRPSARGSDWVTIQAPYPTWPTLAPTADRQLGTLFNISGNDALDLATQWLVAGIEMDERGATLSLMDDDDRIYAESDDVPIPANPPLT